MSTVVQPNVLQEEFDVFILGKSNETKKNYTRYFKIFKQFIGEKNNMISLLTVKQYVEFIKENYSQIVTRQNLKTVSSFLNHLNSEGIISRNYTKVLKMSKLDNLHSRDEMTDEDLTKMLNYQKDPIVRLLFQVLYYTAARLGELMKVKKDDITFHGSKAEILVKNTKGNKMRKLQMKSTKDFLKRYDKMDNVDYLFNSSTKGIPMSRNTAHVYIKRAIKEMNLNPKYSAHWLRHKAALDLYKGSNHDLKFVSNYLGHSNTVVTENYIKTDPNKSKGIDILDKREGDNIEFEIDDLKEQVEDIAESSISVKEKQKQIQRKNEKIIKEQNKLIAYKEKQIKKKSKLDQCIDSCRTKYK